MLKAVLESDQSIPAIPSIRGLLRSIAAEDGVLRNDAGSFDALATSLTTEKNWTPSAKTISFFDNCACRIARQPVQYQDLANEMNASDAAICLLPFCIAEQWPFVTGNENVADQKNIAEWVIRLLALLTRAGEDTDVIHKVHSQILNGTNDATLKRNLREGYEQRLKEIVAPLQSKGIEVVASVFNFPSIGGDANKHVALEAIFGPQLKGMQSMETLERFNHEDVEAVVASGRLGRLCRSLSSFVEETRRQGFMTLQGMKKQIEVRRATK